VTAETEEELIKKLNEWKDNVESKGMRVSMNKTKVMIRCGPQDSEGEAGGCKMAMWQFNSVLHCEPKKTRHYSILPDVNQFSKFFQLDSVGIL